MTVDSVEGLALKGDFHTLPDVFHDLQKVR
jgi:hypothetical protein